MVGFNINFVFERNNELFKIDFMNEYMTHLISSSRGHNETNKF